MSKKWNINTVDLQRIFKNALIFSAPALIVFFTQLQGGTPIGTAVNALYVWVLGVVLDFLRKLSNGK